MVDLDTDIYGAEIKHTQLSNGRFRANIQRVSLVNSVLDSGIFSQNISGAGKMPNNAYTFVFVPCSDAGHLNNVPLSRGMRLYQPGAEIDGILPPKYPWYSFSIKCSILHEMLEVIGLDQAVFRRIGNASLISDFEFRNLEVKLAEVYTQGNEQEIFGDARSIEESIVLEFIDAIDSAPDSVPIAPRKHGALHKALDIMHCDTNRPLTISDLCRQLRCSRRQVEYLFNQSYSMGPATYHRKVRLNKTHRRLLKEQPESATVSEIAVEFGFFHYGRFSRYYRDCFGEYPHQTLQRRQA